MKKFLAGFIFCLILLVCVPAFASGAKKTVSAILGQNKVVFDGITLNVDTLVYEDKTYIPIRDAAEAIGQDVTYDAKTNTVYVGRVPKNR